MSATQPQMPLPEVLMQMISGKWLTKAILCRCQTSGLSH
jgi:hypothetical protein